MCGQNRKPRVKFEALVISFRRSRQCGAVSPASSRVAAAMMRIMTYAMTTKSSAAGLAKLHARKYRQSKSAVLLRRGVSQRGKLPILDCRRICWVCQG